VRLFNVEKKRGDRMRKYYLEDKINNNFLWKEKPITMSKLVLTCKPVNIALDKVFYNGKYWDIMTVIE